MQKSVTRVQKSVTRVQKSVTRVQKSVTRVQKSVTRVQESVTTVQNFVTNVSEFPPKYKFFLISKTNMAGASSERFPNVETYTIQELQNNAKNKNTSTSTKFWITVFKSWAKQKRFPEEIETFEPSELDTALQQFYAEVRNKDGEDYEPDSLRVMNAALDRHLKEHGYKQSIIRDREFFTSKQVLEGKARRLREEGKGKRQNKARSLSKEEEEVLWVAGKLGNNSPESLVNTIWWILTQYFGLRGRQEHHSMKVDDFALRKDDDGQEYVEFAEGLTKTRGGGLSKKSRDFSPKMFATGGERCPVSLFKEYLSRRPQQMKTTGPFYLSVNYNAKDEIWYKAQPMGINRINEMMKRIVAGSSLETSCKKLTNHSARKTLVNKLKKTNVERSSIVKVTGHRNLQSLDDYDEGDEAEIFLQKYPDETTCKYLTLPSILTTNDRVPQQQI